MKHRSITFAAIAAASLALAACGGSSGGDSSSSASGSSSGSASPSVTGLVQIVELIPSPAVAGLTKGYEQKAQELGLTTATAQAGGDPSKQSAAIKDAVAKGAKGLFIIPLPGDVPAVTEAVNSGICVGIAYSQYSGSNPFAPGVKVYFGWDDTTGSTNLTKAVAEKMGGKGGLVYIGGVAQDPGNVTREKALKAELAANYPGITLLASEPADYDGAKARTIMQNLVQKYGDQITGVITAADNMSQAVAEYVANSPLAGKVTIGGFGGQKEFVDEIKAGKAYATVPFPVVSDASRAMQAVYDCMNGNKETVTQTSDTEPVLEPLKSAGFIVTAENVNDYTPQY